MARTWSLALLEFSTPTKKVDVFWSEIVQNVERLKKTKETAKELSGLPGKHSSLVF